MRNTGKDLRSRATRREGVGRRGLTLIELLVVVSIMMVLVVVTVPRMRPAMENRRIREAARAVNVYLGSARSRAIESGRPWGVAIVRDGNLALAGAKLIQVEVPPPYAGEMEGSRMVFLSLSGLSGRAQFWSDSSGTQLEDPIGAGLVQPGDSVKFGYQGHLFRIQTITPVGPNPPNTWDFTFTSKTAAALPDMLPPNPSSTPQERYAASRPFQILRQPVTAPVAPLRLPRGVVIDLWYSGTASAWFANTATTALKLPYPTILFSSTGAVHEVASDTMGAVPAIEPIFLLVGRRDRVNPDPMQGNDANHTIPAVAEDGRTNLDDLANLWVAINPQTGYIVCAENSAGANIGEIRQYARDFQAMGGR